MLGVHFVSLTRKGRQYGESGRDKTGAGTSQGMPKIVGDPHKPGSFEPVPQGSTVKGSNCASYHCHLILMFLNFYYATSPLKRVMNEMEQNILQGFVDIRHGGSSSWLDHS